MGIKTHTKDIDGRQFHVNTFPARKAISILSRLTGLVGPGLGEGLKAFAKASPDSPDGVANILDVDIDYGVAGSLIKELVSRLDETKVLKLILDMFDAGQVMLIRDKENGEGKIKIDLSGNALEQFDNEFSGELFTLGKLLAFLIEVNYKDFFGKSGIGGMITAIKSTLKSEPPSSMQTTDSTKA